MQVESAVIEDGGSVNNKTLTFIKYFVVMTGIILTIISELKSAGFNIWYVLWLCFPYGAYYLAATKAENISHGASIGGGALILGVDLAIRIQVIFFPDSSTDSIALLMMPFWQSVLIMPIGFLLGWMIEKLINKVFLKG